MRCSGGGRDGDTRAWNGGKNTQIHNIKLYTNESWILGGIDDDVKKVKFAVR